MLDNMGTQTVSGDSSSPANINLKYLIADYDFIPDSGAGMDAGRNSFHHGNRYFCLYY